ncbi:MAG: hypothetical protein Q8R08_00770 [bacterium]|nr:hypothetical protein [bacterium]
MENDTQDDTEAEILGPHLIVKCPIHGAQYAVDAGKGQVCSCPLCLQESLNEGE